MVSFQFKPFVEMQPEDYETVGFKSGLEIHQQLLTSKKLFCRCPAGRYSEQYDAEILRHMRPTLSELGEYDGTALMEFKTKKEIIYRIHRDTVCTYEMDDTPPFQINEEALDSALAIGMLYDSAIVDELHIARKQYLDGSIPTGFQRTAIVCVGGAIPFNGREVRVIQLSIEEDSCREVSDVGHFRVYLTDRLGMPLIETVTGADMLTPQEVAEVAEICRRLARSTGRVRTGIGAARQDVNVSVTGGTRIEIKGVPRIPMIPLLTYNEAMRQWNLLRLREELKERGITPDTFRSSSEDVTRLVRKSHFLPIQEALAAEKLVHCVVLKGFRGLLRWQTQTDTVFSKEISDRVRVVACLTTLPNIIHSDSPSETVSSSEWHSIRKAVNATDEDTLVLVWGDAVDVSTGVKEIVIRAREATIGIPSETRQALRDGTNGFERILPGPDRMYPDTDLPPKRITDERIEQVRQTLPDPIWTRETWYRSLGVPSDCILPLSMSCFAGLFEQSVRNWKLDARQLAVLLIQVPKRLRKKGLHPERIRADALREMLKAWAENRATREGLMLAMEEISGAGSSLEGMLPPLCTEEYAKTVLERALSFGDEAVLRNPAKRHEVLMGIAMKTLRGRIRGATVASLLNTLLSEEG
jgi:glutamyl-tRNA(Gln) amidotransferase subunit E